MIVFRSLVGAAVSLTLASGIAPADEPKKPKVLPEQVSYYRDVRPVFQQHCQGCHQPAKAAGRLRHDRSRRACSRPAISDKPGVVPGQPEESELIVQIMPKDGKAAMPKGKPPLVRL